MPRRAGVPDHQGGRAPVRRIAGQAGDRQIAVARGGDRLGLGLTGADEHQRVQARGDAGHPDPGNPVAERGDKLVAPPPVGDPGVPDLAVVAAGGDELGERELADHVRAPAGQPRRRHRLVEQPPRHGQPAQVQSGRQGLARRPAVDDVVRRQRLHRAHRVPVVAELAVVVVFHQHRAGAGGPLGEQPAARRRERHAERELVCRGQQRGACPAEHRAVRHRAVRVDRQRGETQAARDDGAMFRKAAGFHRHGARAAGPQHLGEQAEAVPEAGADDDQVRVGGDPPRPREVARQGLAQPRQAPRVRVVQHVAGGARQRPAGGGEPLTARERGQVGSPGAQVVPELPGGRRTGRRLRRGRRRHPGHPCPGAGAGGEPALGDELRVRVGDRVAGDPQVGAERPRRGQPRPRRQPAVADRGAQRAFQRPPQPGRVQVDVEVQIQIGPMF